MVLKCLENRIAAKINTLESYHFIYRYPCPSQLYIFFRRKPQYCGNAKRIATRSVLKMLQMDLITMLRLDFELECEVNMISIISDNARTHSDNFRHWFQQRMKKERQRAERWSSDLHPNVATTAQEHDECSFKRTPPRVPQRQISKHLLMKISRVGVGSGGGGCGLDPSFSDETERFLVNTQRCTPKFPQRKLTPTHPVIPKVPQRKVTPPRDLPKRESGQKRMPARFSQKDSVQLMARSIVFDRIGPARIQRRRKIQLKDDIAIIVGSMKKDVQKSSSFQYDRPFMCQSGQRHSSLQMRRNSFQGLQIKT